MPQACGEKASGCPRIMRNPGGPGYVGLNEDVKDSAIRILVWGLIQEGKEGFEPGSIDV